MTSGFARTNDPAVIEHRLLDLAYTTDSVITAPLLAFYTPCSIEDAEHVLDRLCAENRLHLEVDDEGNVRYVVPNRQRLAAPRAPVALTRPPLAGLEVAPPPHPTVAALLSLLVPGAGQLYAGRPLSGLVWFLVVTLGYLMLIVPGVLLHIVCVASAASAAHHTRTTTTP
jgi:TM2 domain-containing membrane protein YozV